MLIELDLKLLQDVRKVAGKDIHSVAGTISGYVGWNDLASEEADEALREDYLRRASASERVLRSFLVTNDLRTSKVIVDAAIKEEEKSNVIL